MFTISDVDSDSMRLLEFFWMLPTDKQTRLLREASISACFHLLKDEPAYAREAGRATDEVHFAEMVLWRCRPTFPFAWFGDQHWTDPTMEDLFAGQFEGRATTFVLASEKDDGRNVERIADSLDFQIEEANRWRSGLRFEDDELGIDREALQRYIENWREAFFFVLFSKASKDTSD